MSGSRSQQAVEPRAAKSRASHRLEKLAGVAASAALATGFLGGTPALAYTPPPAAVRVATPPLPDDGGETILLDYGKVRQRRRTTSVCVVAGSKGNQRQEEMLGQERRVGASRGADGKRGVCGGR